MKILYLTHLERVAPRLHLEINTLRAKGHSVRVVAWNTSGKDHGYDFPVTFIHNKSRVRFDESMKQGLLTTLRRVAGGLYPRTLKEIMTSSWDVIHVGHLSLLPLAVLGKVVKGGKIVYDSYEFPKENIPSRLKNRQIATLLGLSIGIVERFLLYWVDGVLTIPSVGNLEKIKFSRECKNVAVLLNVPALEGIIDKKTYSPSPTATFVGGITWEKGLGPMLNATSILTTAIPDFKLILIGPLYENYEEVLQKIDSLGIRDNVVMHPHWVPPEKVREIIVNGWIGLWLNQPSTRFSRVTTGNSRKAFEYMKYGLPVVATAFGEVAKAVAEEQAGILVDATDPAAIAKAMQTIIENEEMRQKMSDNGLAAVQNKYNWENESKKLLDIYARLTG